MSFDILSFLLGVVIGFLLKYINFKNLKQDFKTDFKPNIYPKEEEIKYKQIY